MVALIIVIVQILIIIIEIVVLTTTLIEAILVHIETILHAHHLQIGRVVVEVTTVDLAGVATHHLRTHHRDTAEMSEDNSYLLKKI